jgi:hypothetical protein
METIFTLGDADTGNTGPLKIDMDELYERKKQQDLNTLALYKRILDRIHTRIKTVSRQQKQEQYCWYVVPEIIIGIPRYDNGACIAYLIDSLRENGFLVKYTHPNLLLMSWAHWCPTYVRTEVKKKTGITVDCYGKTIKNEEDEDDTNPLMLLANKNNANNAVNANPKAKEYTPIQMYKPTGLIYNPTLLKSIEEKSL